MSDIRTFRDLIAWQRAIELARGVYTATTRMPDAERFGLTNQMRRAAVSVPSNIAEGYARQSTSDYTRFLRLARGSLAELSTQYDLATSMAMIPHDLPLLDLLAETDRTPRPPPQPRKQTPRALTPMPLLSPPLRASVPTP